MEIRTALNCWKEQECYEQASAHRFQESAARQVDIFKARPNLVQIFILLWGPGRGIDKYQFSHKPTYRKIQDQNLNLSFRPNSFYKLALKNGGQKICANS